MAISLLPGRKETVHRYGLYCYSHHESRELRSLCWFLCGHRSCTKNFIIMQGRPTLTKDDLSSKLADLALNAWRGKENCEQQGLNPGSPRSLHKQERSITQHFRQVSY